MRISTRNANGSGYVKRSDANASPLVVVSVAAVRVTVFHLFFRGVANVDDFYVEVEVLACEGVVAVDSRVSVVQGSNSHDLDVALA